MKFLAAFITLATLLPLSSQSQESGVPFHVSPPNKPWAFEITAPGFTVATSGPENGRWRLQAGKGEFVISITLEQVKGAAKLSNCKDTLRSRTESPLFSFKGIKQSQRGDMAVLEYMIPEFEGAKVNQKNLLGCLAKEDVYIDIHLSKLSFQPDDQAALDAILNSSKFVAAAAQSPQPVQSESAALFSEGSRSFIAGQFDRAIPAYQRALELEKRQPTFTPAMWRVLVDNLAMAYGISGNLKASEELLQYGIDKDPSYPMFYYIMANAFGERNDLPGTLKYLKLALANKANMNAGESLPNPLTDDSFKRFVKNEEFRKLSAEFK